MKKTLQKQIFEHKRQHKRSLNQKLHSQRETNRESIKKVKSCTDRQTGMQRDKTCKQKYTH